jgi:simple sugar transport system permease protein
METFLIGLIAATFRVSTPLIFGTLGELFAERSGVLNLGIEGTMFFGAFVGFTVSSLTGSLWIGLLAAVVAGALSGWLMALLTVRLGVNQHVSGLGITLLWTGFSMFSFGLVFGNPSTQPTVEPFQPLTPFHSVPVLGQIFEQQWLTYLALLLIPIVWWVIYRTSFGLNIRAAGENPEAADAAGLDVHRIRTQALIIGGALMGVAGAFLSLAQLGSFTYGIVAGRGWVCIALIIFANWEAVRVLWGSLLYGSVSALQLRLQTLGLDLPYELFLALPYLVTILALVVAGRNVSAPAYLLKPYRRE